jgi:hypothetical protein
VIHLTQLEKLSLYGMLRIVTHTLLINDNHTHTHTHTHIHTHISHIHTLAQQNTHAHIYLRSPMNNTHIHSLTHLFHQNTHTSHKTHTFDIIHFYYRSSTSNPRLKTKNHGQTDRQTDRQNQIFSDYGQTDIKKFPVSVETYFLF